MFRFTDAAFAPRRPLVQSAISKLPQAHFKALDAAHQHVFEQVRARADEEGLTTDPIIRTPHGVSIDSSSAGQALFDHEYGTAESAPNPILRLAARRALPRATSIYNTVVRQEIGF